MNDKTENNKKNVIEIIDFNFIDFEPGSTLAVHRMKERQVVT